MSWSFFSGLNPFLGLVAPAEDTGKAFRDALEDNPQLKDPEYLRENHAPPWYDPDSGVNKLFDELGRGLLDKLSDILPDDLFNQDKPSSPNSPHPFEQNTLNYLNAEMAKFYGMDRNTAYQEALSNTAYQRAVADMKRAGLNPAAIFGAGRGSSAGGVAYVSAGSGYSGSAKSSKLFSSEDFGLIASLTGLATAVATKKPSNFWLGQQGAQAVMQVLNGLDRKFK